MLFCVFFFFVNLCAPHVHVFMPPKYRAARVDWTVQMHAGTWIYLHRVERMEAQEGAITRAEVKRRRRKWEK